MAGEPLGWRILLEGRRERAQRQVKPSEAVWSILLLGLGLTLALIVLPYSLVGQRVGASELLLTFGVALVAGIPAGYALIRPLITGIARGRPVVMGTFLLRFFLDLFLVAAAAIALASPLAGLIAGYASPYVVSTLASGLQGAIVSGYLIGSGTVKVLFAVWWHRVRPESSASSTSSVLP